mmetsp:Transcript_18110/g.38708  ORF Transcript_18110/g.38708 Transcript_18110/m.38708 type:complete len:284 (-) Transcript_18110:313-1164(-)
MLGVWGAWTNGRGVSAKSFRTWARLSQRIPLEDKIKRPLNCALNFDFDGFDGFDDFFFFFFAPKERSDRHVATYASRLEGSGDGDGVMAVWQKPSDDRNDGVRCAQHRALEPIPAAVTQHARRDEDAEQENRRREDVEVQANRHSVAPSDDHGVGNDKECDLRRRSHCDAKREIHQVVVGCCDRSRVLCRVSYDRKKDETDEGIGHVVVCGHFVDGLHQELRAGHDRARGDQEHEERGPEGELVLLHGGHRRGRLQEGAGHSLLSELVLLSVLIHVQLRYLER